MSSAINEPAKGNAKRRKAPLRTGIYFCLLCLIAVCLWFRFHSASSSPVVSPSGIAKGGFECKETAIDFGKVRLGQPIHRTIRLFNDSSETRHIVKVTPSRAFVKAVGFSKTVAPQSCGEVAVSIDPAGKPGLYYACVLIETDHPQRSHINPGVSCEVLPGGTSKPQRVP